MKEMIMEIMQPALATLLTAVVAAIGIYIRGKIKSAAALRVYDEVVHALKAGMAVAKDEVVRPAKSKGVIGKLDSVDIKKAEEKALSVAKEVAKGKALDFINNMQGAEVKSLIKDIKARMK